MAFLVVALLTRAAAGVKWNAGTAALANPTNVGGFTGRMRHTATSVGVCSIGTHSQRATCEDAGGVWTGTVYVFGGESDAGFTYKDALVADARDLYKYDLATGTWARVAPGTARPPSGSAANMPASHYYLDDGRPRVRRSAHSAAVVYHPKQGNPVNGRPFIVVFGGTDLEKDAAVVTGAGEQGVRAVRSKDLDDVLLFDPLRPMDVPPDKTGPRWSVPDFVAVGSQGVKRPDPRHGHAAATFERTGMVVFGGYAKERVTEWCGSCPYLNDLWILTNDGGVKWKWTYVDNAGFDWPHLLHPLSVRPHERYGHSFDNFGDATSEASGKTTMVLFGGKTYNYGDGPGRGNIEYRKDVWVLEARYTGTHPLKSSGVTEDNLQLFWRIKPTRGDKLLAPRAFHATAVDVDGAKMYVFGGYAVDHDAKRAPRFFDDVWELDLATWQWTDLTASSGNSGVAGAHMSARAHHSAALLRYAPGLHGGGATVLIVSGLTRVRATGSACGDACGLQTTLPQPQVQSVDDFSALERCSGSTDTPKELGVNSTLASQCVYQFDLF